MLDCAGFCWILLDFAEFCWNRVLQTMVERLEELAILSVVEGEEHVAQLVGNVAVFQGGIWQENLFFRAISE